ncbi:MAG TPA: hypothetical protein VGF14_00520 [Alphaproteobacteria bacterium]
MSRRNAYDMDSLNDTADSALGGALNKTVYKDGERVRLGDFTAEELKKNVVEKSDYKIKDGDAFDDAFLNYYIAPDVKNVNELGREWLIQKAHKKGRNDGLLKGVIYTAASIAFAGFIANELGALEIKLNDFEHKKPATEIEIGEAPADSVKNIPVLQLK